MLTVSVQACTCHIHLAVMYTTLFGTQYPHRSPSARHRANALANSMQWYAFGRSHRPRSLHTTLPISSRMIDSSRGANGDIYLRWGAGAGGTWHGPLEVNGRVFSSKARSAKYPVTRRSTARQLHTSRLDVAQGNISLTGAIHRHRGRAITLLKDDGPLSSPSAASVVVGATGLPVHES